jgi:hypothetical protein
MHPSVVEGCNVLQFLFWVATSGKPFRKTASSASGDHDSCTLMSYRSLESVESPFGTSAFSVFSNYLTVELWMVSSSGDTSSLFIIVTYLPCSTSAHKLSM